MADNQAVQDDLESFIPPNLPSKCTWTANKDGPPDPHQHKQIVKKPPIFPNILMQIGDTPLVRLNKIPQAYSIKCEVLAKCEFLNAGGSVKDRIALRMIEDAEREGKIAPGWTLIEPTSGNTGIGLALAGAVKGYRCIIVMPEKMSSEKVNILHALGAEIIRTPTSAKFDSPQSLIRVAQRLNKQIPNSIVLDQYRNAGNPLAHYDHTAEEILRQCDYKVDAVVISAGTGGTVAGIGRKFKEACPDCLIVGADPLGSILAEPEEINETDVSFYEVEGIGYDFIPTVCDRSVVDTWIKTDDKSSLLMARQLISKEGLLCGGSSGSAVIAALEACKNLRKDQRCVVILPDGVRNYMTKFVDDDWMAERNILEPLKDSDLKKPWFWEQSIDTMAAGMHVISVNSRTKIGEAIHLMKTGGYDQLPVLDNSVLVGMITVANTMARIAGGIVTVESPVTEVLLKNYPKISRNANVGKLSTMLKSSQYVVVVDDVLPDRIVSIVTHIDILNYLSIAGTYQ